MRFPSLILTILIFGVLSARADSLRVIGALLDTDGNPTNGYQVSLRVGRAGVDIVNVRTEEGVFEIFKEDVDPETIKQWQVVAFSEGKVVQMPLKFNHDTTPTSWIAKLTIRLKSTRQRRYSRSAAIAVISEFTTVQDLRVIANELTKDEADKIVAKETAQILRRTDLGEASDEGLAAIYDGILKSGDNSLLSTVVTNKNSFFALIDNPDYKNYNPEMDPEPLETEKAPQYNVAYPSFGLGNRIATVTPSFYPETGYTAVISSSNNLSFRVGRRFDFDPRVSASISKITPGVNYSLNMKYVDVPDYVLLGNAVNLTDTMQLYVRDSSAKSNFGIANNDRDIWSGRVGLIWPGNVESLFFNLGSSNTITALRKPTGLFFAAPMTLDIRTKLFPKLSSNSSSLRGLGMFRPFFSLNPSYMQNFPHCAFLNCVKSSE